MGRLPNQSTGDEASVKAEAPSVDGRGQYPADLVEVEGEREGVERHQRDWSDKEASEVPKAPRTISPVCKSRS